MSRTRDVTRTAQFRPNRVAVGQLQGVDVVQLVPFAAEQHGSAVGEHGQAVVASSTRDVTRTAQFRPIRPAAAHLQCVDVAPPIIAKQHGGAVGEQCQAVGASCKRDVTRTAQFRPIRPAAGHLQGVDVALPIAKLARQCRRRARSVSAKIAHSGRHPNCSVPSKSRRC